MEPRNSALLLGKLLGRALEEALKQLSPIEAEIITLHWGLAGEYLSVREIAQKCNITRARAGQHLAKAERELTRLIFNHPKKQRDKKIFRIKVLD